MRDTGVSPLAGAFVEGLAAIWATGWAGKSLTLAVGWLAVTVAPDANNVLNVLTIALVVLVALPIAKGRRKDATIKDLNDALAAKDTRNKDLSSDLHDRTQQVRNLEQGFGHLKEQLAAAEARYEEQGKYTAQASVERFEGLLTAQTVTLGQIATTLQQVERKLNASG